MVFGFGKKKQPQPTPQQPEQKQPELKPQPEPKKSEQKPTKKGLFSRLSRGLGKTRQRFSSGVSTLLLGRKEIDDDLMEELETYLLSADVGLAATSHFIKELTAQISRKHIQDPAVLLDTLKTIMTETLSVAEHNFSIEAAKPFTLMMIGINGSGKTTTTGKLASRLLGEGRSVLLAAADTFRAAAVEQLQTWGERHNVPVIAQHTGADSAAVAFDAVQSAQAKNVDCLIIDTAGRLHTQNHLMQELEKIKRVMGKVDEHAPHETMLVLDASIGQNALQQAKLFHEAIGVTSLCITKLDGTAKGGILFAIVKELGLPIRYIGVGEQAEDLQPFVAKDFVDALFINEHDS